MSDQTNTDTIDQQPVDETAEQPVEQPQEAPEQQPEWAQRFSDPDAMYRSYREAERAMTQAQQRAAELERQQQEYAQQQQDWRDPLTDLTGPYLDEAQQRDLAAKAEREPARWAQWAMENVDYVGEDVRNQLLAYWQSRDPLGYQQWSFEAYREQIRSEIMGEVAPLQQQHRVAAANFTVEQAAKQIPDWPTWQEPMVSFLESDRGAFIRKELDSATEALDTNRAVDLLYQVYGIVHAENSRQRALTGANTPAPPPPPNAASETTSSGPPRGEDGKFINTHSATSNPGRRKGRLDNLGS